MKANSIGDAEMIEALYEASRAGVRIDLVVRGISCLRAGVEGLSENIHVRSILGRYLEHSRIYRFRHGDVDDTPLYLIGSADIMPRNLDRRVEVLVPIEHPKHRDWLDHVLDVPARRRHRALGAAPGRHVGTDRPARRLRAARPGAPVPLGRRAPGADPQVAPVSGLRGFGPDGPKSPPIRPGVARRSPLVHHRPASRSPALPTFAVGAPAPHLTRLQYAHERSSTA